MNRKCYIVGAGDNSGTNFLKKENEYVIAADGGLEQVEKLGIKPDLIVGDFDSLGYVPEGDNVVKFKSEKDDSDMMLSMKFALEKGYNDIVIFGGTGGRVDHTFANIQTMLYGVNNGAKVTMISKDNNYYVISNDEIVLEKNKDTMFSVFAIGGNAEGVTIKGGKYEIEKITLFSNNPLGLSNKIASDNVYISVSEGNLLIICENNK